MKIEKMVCEYCGKVFYSEYWEGGYIDHYMNFAQNKKLYGKDIKHDVHEICYDGNDLRKEEDMKNRLYCYLKWDNISDDTKNRVKEKCEFLINKIIKTRKNAKDIVSGLKMLERRLLIEEAQDNCHKPYGDEDDKLWD